MKYSCFILACLFCLRSLSQPYRLDNIHAHNDYDHNVPFTEAYRLGIGSIEADVLLINDTLFVAHSSREIKRNVLFEENYLKQLAEGIRSNKGYVYADTGRVLQLLIDIKTDSLTTLQAVVRSIRKFPELLHCRSVRFVITGNQPNPATFPDYPSFLLFDGKIRDAEHIRQVSRIGLFSANFASYSKWKGVGDIPSEDLVNIKRDIEKAHYLNRAFRFWGVPDNATTWKIMMGLGVDYLNTDHIQDLARFLGNRN
jgi:alkaline phosphatase